MSKTIFLYSNFILSRCLYVFSGSTYLVKLTH